MSIVTVHQLDLHRARQIMVIAFFWWLIGLYKTLAIASGHPVIDWNESTHSSAVSALLYDVYNYHAKMLCHVRPYPAENTGSRPLSHSQAAEGWISSWVGDDQRIPGVVRILFLVPFWFTGSTA